MYCLSVEKFIFVSTDLVAAELPCFCLFTAKLYFYSNAYWLLHIDKQVDREYYYKNTNAILQLFNIAKYTGHKQTYTAKYTCWKIQKHTRNNSYKIVGHCFWSVKSHRKNLSQILTPFLDIYMFNPLILLVS